MPMLICWGETVALISASGALEACQYMSGWTNQRSNKPLTCWSVKSQSGKIYGNECNATAINHCSPTNTAHADGVYPTISSVQCCLGFAVLFLQRFCNSCFPSSQVGWHGEILYKEILYKLYSLGSLAKLWDPDKNQTKHVVKLL